MSFQISILQTGDFAILDLCGRSTIDNGDSELLSRHVQELVAFGVRQFLLNLANLTQIDSSGISGIVKTYRSLRDQGCDLRLLCPNGTQSSRLRYEAVGYGNPVELTLACRRTC